MKICLGCFTKETSLLENEVDIPGHGAHCVYRPKGKGSQSLLFLLTPPAQSMKLAWPETLITVPQCCSLHVLLVRGLGKEAATKKRVLFVPICFLEYHTPP